MDRPREARPNNADIKDSRGDANVPQTANSPAAGIITDSEGESADTPFEVWPGDADDRQYAIHCGSIDQSLGLPNAAEADRHQFAEVESPDDSSESARRVDAESEEQLHSFPIAVRTSISEIEDRHSLTESGLPDLEEYTSEAHSAFSEPEPSRRSLELDASEDSFLLIQRYYEGDDRPEED